mmetsp:Transcript_26027/g.69580  ORF Transcript_26027/g.69580 Transcript_26027/m.69580 type:complete len:212 (-) Transcript_26027:76-711(-)
MVAPAQMDAALTDTSFEHREAAVLEWLLGKPGVAEAVGLALQHREADAKHLLVNELRMLNGGSAWGPPLPPAPLWRLELPEVSKVLVQGVLPTSLAPTCRPCAVLLRPERDGGRRCEEMEEALRGLEGQEVEVLMSQIVIDELAACAVIQLPAHVPCASEVPHVLLGAQAGTSAAYAERMLLQARAGSRTGAKSIPLPRTRRLKGTLVYAA